MIPSIPIAPLLALAFGFALAWAVDKARRKR